MLGVRSFMTETIVQPLVLPAIVDLDALESVRDDVMEALEQGPVHVDATAVERVATNALLLFISASETAKRNGFDFKISAVSDPMQAAITRLGMSDAFSNMVKG